MNKELLTKILNKYEIQLKDDGPMFLALTHSSYANEHHLPSNERIEFLGDAVLGLLVAEYIYKNFEEYQEGQMSKLRATYVCEDANAEYARNIGVDQLLMLGHGEEQSGGRTRPAIINDAFEAFLGAIYLSNGINDVKKILEKEVFPHIKALDDRQFVDYKSKLQECVQAETRNALEYRLIEQTGPAHNRSFQMAVYLENVMLGRGTGKSKKDASQKAAEDALSKMAIADSSESSANNNE
jgi:ribonuclease-3